MNNKYLKCSPCPASQLLDDKRMALIERWECKRDSYLSRTKNVKLILLGESMPASRYFYDIETDYQDSGLRYSLKKEFGKLELNDSQFLMSMTRKGIVLFDCALCPLHQLYDNATKRHAATYCFLSITHETISKFTDTPIVTVFPANRGWLKSEIPSEIRYRVQGECTFSDQSGLSDFYKELITKNYNQIIFNYGIIRLNKK